jgi:hypothetical protein
VSDTGPPWRCVAKRIAPTERVVEWDDHDLTGTLTVVNPNFSVLSEVLAKAEEARCGSR